jgi:hypothetical protein
MKQTNERTHARTQTHINERTNEQRNIFSSYVMLLDRRYRYFIKYSSEDIYQVTEY